MAKLKRDERLCPFCAETIKAAAIRCRYCQADLTEHPAAAEPEPPSDRESDEVEDVASVRLAKPELPSAPPRLDPGPAPAQPAGRLLTAILAALVVVAAIGVGVLWSKAENPDAVTAPGGALVGDEPRANALVAGADLTQRALSYDYRTFANDMQVARGSMTPSFRKEYDQTMGQIRANTLKNRIKLQAVVVSSAVVEATEHKARLLIFLNQTTTAATTKNEQLDRNSLLVTLVRGHGDWKLDKLSALG